MKYFIDTEFIEGFYNPFLGKRRHFIDLISIGIVAEDGREYYAISKEFDASKANDWVKQNVISKLPSRAKKSYHHPDYPAINWTVENGFYKSNKQIAEEIIEFINPGLCFPVMAYNNSELKPDNGHFLSKHFDAHNVAGFLINGTEYYCAQPEFYGYFSDYDWVLFASLFGDMNSLPKGFPYYCHDLKQTFDELKLDEEWKKKYCPGPEDEHNALADAKWNMKLYQAMNEEKKLQENLRLVEQIKIKNTGLL